MHKIFDVIDVKGADVRTIGRSATVFEAVRCMVENNCGSLLVTGDDGELVGIITERDYLRRVVLEGRTSKTTRVEEIMSSRLVYVDHDYTVEQALAVMTAKRIRHLPVLRDEKLCGVVSIGDLVKHLVREQKFEIQYLTDYITGKYPG